MKKIMLFIVGMSLIVALSACAVGNGSTSSEQTVDDLALESSGADTEFTIGNEAAGEDGTTTTVATLQPVEINEDSEDYDWDQADEVAITLSDNGSQSAGADVAVLGNVITISAPGTYRLSGSLSNGEIIVSTEADGIVRLILDSVDIHNETGSAIYVEDADKVVVYLPAGSENYLSDGASYELPDPESDEPNATLFSKADLTIDGFGALMVTGNYNDAIASKDGLIVNNGEITVLAVDDGLRGKDYVLIRTADLVVDAGGDGVKSDETEDTSKGYVMIESGSLEIRAGMDGIDAETAVTITDGTFNISAGDGAQGMAADDTSMKAIKAGISVEINGGTFIIDSRDDAIHSNGTILITGGVFSIASGDDGMHADSELTIEGGQIDITQSYEGLESATITINAGQINIVSDDDGINLAGGVDGSGMNAGMGGGRGGQNAGPGFDAFGGGGDYALYINGGTIYVNATGDGIDSNGSITIAGGTVVVNGPTENMNGALDYMGSFTISGGTLVAAGSAGMAQAPGTNSSQASVAIFFNGAIAAGSPVQIQNSAGEVVMTFVPAKQIQSLVISTADLVVGETYSVVVGGSVANMDATGFSTGGSSSGGTTYTSFTISSILTQVGTGGGMNFGGGGRR
jgi:hypothetical protein